jgi:hypothetical protein
MMAPRRSAETRPASESNARAYLAEYEPDPIPPADAAAAVEAARRIVAIAEKVVSSIS